MQITRRVRDGVVILDIEGKLAGSVSGSAGLSELVLEQLAVGQDADGPPDRVLLNFAACTGADSLGIGELISLHVSVTKRHGKGKMRLADLPDPIRDLLQATQLIDMFDIFDNEDDALRSFS